MITLQHNIRVNDDTVTVTMTTKHFKTIELMNVCKSPDYFIESVAYSGVNQVSYTTYPLLLVLNRFVQTIFRKKNLP